MAGRKAHSLVESMVEQSAVLTDLKKGLLKDVLRAGGLGCVKADSKERKRVVSRDCSMVVVLVFPTVEEWGIDWALDWALDWVLNLVQWWVGCLEGMKELMMELLTELDLMQESVRYLELTRDLMMVRS